MESTSAEGTVRTCNEEKAEDKQKVHPACPAREEVISLCTGELIASEFARLAPPSMRCPVVEQR